MPRENRSTGGPASPSPIGFGSADLNLQNPRFVAQTNVAAPENLFEGLQRILGLGAQVGQQLLGYKAAEIEGKISYDRAVEAKQEREQREKDREAARAAAEYSAEQAVRLAGVSTPEEAEAIKADALKVASEAATVEMKTAAAATVQRAQGEGRERRVEQKQAILDSALAVKTQGDRRIQTAVEANSPEELFALQLEYIYKSSVATDPREAATYNDLRELAFQKRMALEGMAETKNKKEQDALAEKAAVMTRDLLSPLIIERQADISRWIEETEGVSDEALQRTIFDWARGKLMEDPSWAPLMESASDQEQKAVSEMIKRETEPLIRAAVQARNVRQQRRADDIAITSYANRGTADPVAAFNELDKDYELAPEVRNRAAAAISNAFIEAAETPVEKLQRAQEVAEISADRPAVVAATRAAAVVMKKITADVNLERESLLEQGRVDANPLTHGWTSRYAEKDAFMSDVLQRHFGTTVEGLQNSPLPVREYAARLSQQWDEDMNKTVSNNRRAEADIRRLDADMRRKLKVQDAWSTSPLVPILESGSHKDMTVEALEPIVQESLFGYADTMVPSELKKKIFTAVDNPDNFTLIASFWKVAGRSMDPQARNMVLDSPEAMQSWAVGTYLNLLGPEYDGQTTSAMVQELTRNLKADVVQDEQTKAKREEQRVRFAELLSGGAGLDTGLFDFTGTSPKEALATLAPADVATMANYATLASAVPNTVDGGRLMAELMRQDGWGLYSFPAADDGTTFRLIRNVPGINGQVPLPPPQVMETGDWKDYLLSHRQAIADYLQNSQMLGGKPGENPPAGTYTSNTVEDIQLNPFDQDLKSGYVAVKAKVSGRWVTIPVTAVKISEKDYREAWPARVKAQLVEMANTPLYPRLP